METICFEMATYVSRTATTPILNQSNERNATILDGTGRLAALSVGIPQFMLTSTLPVRFAAEFFAGDLHPGDVLVGNDPYHGGGHLPDFNVYSPVFGDDGELMLFASIQCHHGDTGGAMAGGYNVFARDIWSEGTRYPALKMVDAGVERRDVVHMMRTNNRLPGFIGDLRSQVGAAQLGARRLGEVIATYGSDLVRAAVDWTIADATRRLRAEVAALARRDLRGRHLRRRRPRRPHRHPRPRGHHRRRRPSHHRLRRVRHPPRDPGVVHVRQHPGLRDRPAGQPGGPDHPQERGLLRLHRPARAGGVLPQPDRRQAGVERHPPPGRRGGRRHRRGHEPDHPRTVLAPDLQVRQPPPDVGRRRPAHREAVLRPRRGGQRRLGQRGGGRRRVGRARRRPTATSSRPAPRSTRGSSRTCCAAATI